MKNLFKNNFITFLIIHFFVWIGVPSFRKSLPMDSLEAIMWGRYCDWGTNKHPPFSGFLAEWFYKLFGENQIGIYILSQVCVLLAFIFIYKLAKCFLEERKAILSVMILEGVIYYGFSSLEYNVNVVSLALWPMTVYYFYKALQNNQMSAWVLTGVFAGFNIMNKYVGGVLLLCMALYLLCNPEGRKQFKKTGPYVTFVIFLAIIAPHIWWLYQHNFFVIDYFLARTQDPNEAWWWEFGEHFYFPIKFLVSQFLFAAIALIIYVLAYRKAEKEEVSLAQGDKVFLKYMGGLPVLILALIALIEGIKLKSMWGFPCLYLLGILLFTFYPFKLSDALYKKMIRSVYVVMFLLAAADMSIIMFNKSEKINFDGPAFANDMSEAWKKYTKTDLKYVGGEIWYISNVSLYGKGNPKPVAEMIPEHNPWLDQKDIKEKGVLVIFPDRYGFQKLREKYKNMSLPFEYKLEFKNCLGKVKKKTIYYGFLKPEVNND